LYWGETLTNNRVELPIVSVNLSLCPNCNSMTKTVKKKCGKCKEIKKKK
jgi:hypothetical protein